MLSKKYYKKQCYKKKNYRSNCNEPDQINFGRTTTRLRNFKLQFYAPSPCHIDPTTIRLRSGPMTKLIIAHANATLVKQLRACAIPH